ncbi:hypothetical protein, partial [uncultured Nitratireductor sp.]|uniref:hypothetical protein n=1 Tax=uncultured Nitratireductor sp. TaxID=520953 RepID=UPI0025CE40FA
MAVHSLLDRRDGLFGEITVYDLAGRRWLTNNGILQGLAFLEPNSRTIDPDVPQGPGPVQGCTYSLAWLIAASQAPEGRGLMLGLG